MTANQINFYKARNEKEHYERADAETQRHYYATEALSHESNVIQSWFNKQQAAHLERSDAINQAHYQRMDEETARHNTQQEKIGFYQVQLDYQRLPIEQQKADAATTTSEAQERNASTNAYLALGQSSANEATAANKNASTYYIPKYYTLQQLVDEARAADYSMSAVEKGSRIPANIVKAIPIVGLFTGG